ncbi:sulfurtransferase [Aspergillus clavatus NRRL 1]|uniref:Thiosulfate sulfurtransferase, putative n=1 Tax=Aspergillus clavatus (strain ATCC 1007 / CBS 513.65 / DSM 816 / NCTC 3887 / NRRL 1 / QM 1276 / 107) TaxID=344612 RepID=A1C8P8_ASPCL|nr:thiosulfate sulfurtransferase, putative [Aspergillus clavatus NRRL 1]EAW13685.1 thiosulfate sulfurtransferase, putative [Aspergillus clavatus NRRL 1]
MTYPFDSVLVTPAQLHAAVTNPPPRRIIPVAAGRLAAHAQSYQTHHIPGSVFFDMDLIRDTTSPYPQMLPSAADFASHIRALGIQKDDILVLYDAVDVGIYSSPRAAWMFRVFGHERVHVLNNFRVYVTQGFPVATGEFPPPSQRQPPPSPPEDEYADAASGLEKGSVILFEELRDVVLRGGREYQIIDVRIRGRFSGAQPEIYPELSSGHMPGAINVPLAAMLDGESSEFLPRERLREVFEGAGVDGTRPMVLTCNSGVTATALDLALGELGYKNHRRIYDGSWMEWARRVDGPGLIVKDV